MRCFKLLLRDGNCYLSNTFVLPFSAWVFLWSAAPLILWFHIVSIWAVIHSFCFISYGAMPYLKGSWKIRFCEHFLQNVPCKSQMTVLDSTCVCAGPAFQMCCKNTCTAGLPHEPADVWCAAITNMQEMGLRGEWSSCLSSWLESYIIREECWVSSSVLMWQFTRYLSVLSWSGGEGWGKRDTGSHANNQPVWIYVKRVGSGGICCWTFYTSGDPSSI